MEKEVLNVAASGIYRKKTSIVSLHTKLVVTGLSEQQRGMDVFGSRTEFPKKKS